MAKLIFEDNDGAQHELQLKNVPTKTLKSTDMVLIDCEVGQAPPSDVGNYLKNVKDMMQNYFPQNKVIVTAMRDGKKDINLKIVKEKQE